MRLGEIENDCDASGNIHKYQNMLSYLSALSNECYSPLSYFSQSLGPAPSHVLDSGSSIKPTDKGQRPCGIAIQFVYVQRPLLYDLMEQYLKCYRVRNAMLVFQFYLLSLLNLTVFEVLHFMTALRWKQHSFCRR